MLAAAEIRGGIGGKNHLRPGVVADFCRSCPAGRDFAACRDHGACDVTVPPAMLIHVQAMFTLQRKRFPTESSDFITLLDDTPAAISADQDELHFAEVAKQHSRFGRKCTCTPKFATAVFHGSRIAAKRLKRAFTPRIPQRYSATNRGCGGSFRRVSRSVLICMI